MIEGIPDYGGKVHMNGNSGVGEVEFGDDAKLRVYFHSKPMPDILASKEAGRPIFRNVDFVCIQQPAERDIYDQPATMEDKRRFASKWAAYKEGRDQAPQGTPVALLFADNMAIVENLKYFKISTVEQLANLTDTQIQNMGLGGREFMNKAKSYLEKSEKGKGFHELQDQIKNLSLKNEELLARLDAMAQRFTAAGEVIPEPKKKAGRPKKVAATETV